MRFAALASVLCFAIVVTTGCTGERAPTSTDNPHPYPRLLHLEGRTYHAVPVKITSVTENPRDPTRLRVMIDLHTALRQNVGSCLSLHFEGGVRRSSAVSVVLAAATYVRRISIDLGRLSQNTCFSVGKTTELNKTLLSVHGAPELTIRLTSPLGSRDVRDASTGDQIQVRRP